MNGDLDKFSRNGLVGKLLPVFVRYVPDHKITVAQYLFQAFLHGSCIIKKERGFLFFQHKFIQVLPYVSFGTFPDVYFTFMFYDKVI